MDQERAAGIDVSKDTLEIYIDQDGHHQVEYDSSGLQELGDLLDSLDVDMVVMESSGALERRAADALIGFGIVVYCVNATRVRRFAESIGRLEKTDRVDAFVLASYARIAAKHGQAYTPSSQNTRRLRALVTRRRQLIEQRGDEVRRRRRSHVCVDDSFDRVRAVLDEEIATLDAAIEKMLSEPEFADTADRLRSVPSVGPILAAYLLTHLPELGHISSKKIAKLVGVAPMADETGRSSRPRSVRGGRAELRRVLYMATLSAVRYNPHIQCFSKRLRRKGKPAKVAHVACMNKLIRLLNAMERDKIDWQQTHAAAA